VSIDDFLSLLLNHVDLSCEHFSRNFVFFHDFFHRRTPLLSLLKFLSLEVREARDEVVDAGLT